MLTVGAFLAGAAWLYLLLFRDGFWGDDHRLASSLLLIALLYVVPMAAVLSGALTANWTEAWAGIVAWTFLGAAYRPVLRAHGQSPARALLLPPPRRCIGSCCSTRQGASERAHEAPPEASGAEPYPISEIVGA